MKKLQNNFTTPEQSKRLLELGVPADSADCYYNTDGENIGVLPNNTTFWEFNKSIKRVLDKELSICWSVGRLMEIIRICNLTAEKPWAYIERDNIHAMITAITDGVNNRMLDFSKLEE